VSGTHRRYPRLAGEPVGIPSLKGGVDFNYAHDPREETEIEAAHMTTVFLDHPLLLAVCLFVFLMSVVETGFRLAVLTGANLDLRSLERLERNLRSLPPASPNTQRLRADLAPTDSLLA